MSSKSILGGFFQEVEAKWFARGNKQAEPVQTRYEVLLRKGEEVFTGKVVTFSPIDKWCEKEGYILMVVSSKSPALKGEETFLL